MPHTAPATVAGSVDFELQWLVLRRFETWPGWAAEESQPAELAGKVVLVAEPLRIRLCLVSLLPPAWALQIRRKAVHSSHLRLLLLLQEHPTANTIADAGNP